MIEIKMDEAGYEVYYSLDEAVKAFTHNIALENATLDLDIGLLLESDVDPFSNYGMEAISDRVKEMASKAKSNFVLYAKKLINLLFGWLIKFFKGVVDVKKSMSENYNKAKKYIEALNKYESQARQSNEKTIEITNSGNIVVYGLTTIQLIIRCMDHIGVGMKEMASVDPKTTSNYGVGLQIMGGMIKSLNTMYSAIDQLEVSDMANMERQIRSYNFDITKMFENFKDNSGQHRTNKENQKFADKVKADQKVKQDTRDNAKSEVAGEMKSNFKARMEQAQKFMSTPEREEMSCDKAWDYLKNQLTLFIGISKANKWDVEKYVKGAENARRKLTKILDSMNVSAQNEDSIKSALSEIVEVGNMLAQLQKSSGTIVKTVSSALNMMMTDVTKLGSVLTTIGGGPAKDKDAEE